MMRTLKQSPWLRLIRADKPIGTLLLVWPVLWSLWLASGGWPAWHLLGIFIAGAFITRSAGCIINDLWDRDIDGAVKRTADRPLANGELSKRQALSLLAAFAIIALALVLCLNLKSLLVGIIAAALTTLYPSFKRFFPIPQLMLGITFNTGVLMAYTATQNQLPLSAWLLFTATVFWTLAYDTAYAMVDRDDDLKLGLKSSAISFGQFDRLMIAVFQILTLALLISVGIINQLMWVYYLGLGLSALLFGYQQWLIRQRQRQPCFQAFLNNQWIGLIIAASTAVCLL